ncbi:hypothetical protein N9A42_00455 [bacterium]|jgi:hypothetical protein|nr:hypothetical protein [bacterium]
MSISVLVQQVENVYRQSFRPNDPVISRKEILDFVDYCLEYHGHAGIYRDNFTVAEVLKGMIKRFNHLPSCDFDGDSIDRELVRKMVFDLREGK